MHRLVLIIATVLAPVIGFAQSQEPRWLEDTLYGSGKINTVIAVVSIVLIGLFIWMFGMDRRIRRMEQRNK